MRGPVACVCRSKRLVAVVVVALAARRAAAQCVLEPIAKPGKGVIVGMVRDTSGNALDSVEVFIARPRHQTYSVGGTYRIDGLGPDTVVVTARRFGYGSRSRRIVVGDSGAVASFCLPTAQASVLPPLVSAAGRLGLFGVVADTAFGVIPDAEVKVIGAGEVAKSDSTGSFFIRLKPGRYMVRVGRQGFETKNVSVTVPKDSGRRMLIWLNPASPATAARDEWNAYNFQQRIINANPVYTRLVTREDILKSGMTEGLQVARAAAVAPVVDTCWVTVIDPSEHGSVYREPIWAVDAADLEMMEVYAARPARSTPTSIRNGPRPSPAPSFSACPQMYAWIRK